MTLDDASWSLRRAIYDGLAETGRAPDRSALVAHAGDDHSLDRRLRALHDHHQIVVDTDGSIRMALPFSAAPTDHVVWSGERRWFANCAWDALAIPAALGVDAEIEAPWLDDGAPVDLGVVDGALRGDADSHVHFVVPARRWWDDIVHT